jgi:hypothetical protein
MSGAGGWNDDLGGLEARKDWHRPAMREVISEVADLGTLTPVNPGSRQPSLVEMQHAIHPAREVKIVGRD